MSGPRGKVGKSFILVTCTSSGVLWEAGQWVTVGSHSSARRVCKHQSTLFRFKERVLQTPNDLLAAGFEEHKFRNFFNAVS